MNKDYTKLAISRKNQVDESKGSGNYSKEKKGRAGKKAEGDMIYSVRSIEVCYNFEEENPNLPI